MELDTRYHERQKDNKNYQEKNTEASKSTSSHHKNSSISSHKKKNSRIQKRDKPHSSHLNSDHRLMGSEKERVIKEGLCTYCGRKSSLEASEPAYPTIRQISQEGKSLIFSQLLFDHVRTPREDSSESPSLWVTHHTKYIVELPSFPTIEWEFLVIYTPKGENLLLGFKFLNHFNPSIYWRKGLITFNADHKDYYDTSKSSINDVSLANSFAALVGNFRTPSFLSSVHIPSLDSHKSLLSSKDDVFKNIQDVGKDNYMSSLHLFLGNVDLPPAFYHDSLDKLWDEENEPEEIETVMKAVNSVYHHYLDVFSKVNAEKLPPHSACDHYIKLEGSLPPSFSPNQRGLHHFSNPSPPTIVETNESDYALVAILSQLTDSGKNHIAFDSPKSIPEMLNYEINEKELPGIVWALKS
ncbi:hypothetical protein O181_008282 [Austropuccinia psidii MF-1]|uniref:Reverse transcriptase RNase H-like domain-containing protein n=1 Tax=Austropuccinia psidii MF-1 TaxID=1389203 RepID=A0A9Q3GJ95_9BASI|nr:hypothetical protein [Austropuccinia psidii MF-1]